MIGKLDQRAALQSNVCTPDAGGGYSESWQTFAVVWARLMPAGANDVFGPDARESRTRYRLWLRRRRDLAAGLRVVVGARTLLVRALLDEGPRESIVTLLCEELP